MMPNAKHVERLLGEHMCSVLLVFFIVAKLWLINDFEVKLPGSFETLKTKFLPHVGEISSVYTRPFPFLPGMLFFQSA